MIFPDIASTVAELGLDISNRTPRAIIVDDLENADIVFTFLPTTPTSRFLE